MQKNFNHTQIKAKGKKQTRKLTSNGYNYKTQQRNVKLFPCVKVLQNKQEHKTKNHQNVDNQKFT